MKKTKRIVLFGIAVLLITNIFLTFQQKVYANDNNNDNGEPEISNYFDVTSQEFGAIPNDETDDYLAISNALGKAKDIDETITVYIPEGEYTISHQLYIYSNTKLILDEKAIIKSTASEDFTVMLMGANADQTTEHGGYTKIENVEISGGTWDRNSSSDTISCVFVFNHGNKINIHDLTVKGSTDHMINVSANKDVTIKNVVFQNQIPYTGTSANYWDNFDVGDTERHIYTEAIHTDFAGSGEQGALPLDNTTCDNIIIDGCTFNDVLSGIGTHHESEYKAKNITVTNCKFTNIIYGNAINAWSFEDLIVTNNTVTCPKTCITAIGSTMSISNNSFDVMDRNGESTPQFVIRIIRGKASISENTIKGSSKSAIKVDETTELNIIDNTLSNIAKTALDLEKCYESVNVKSNKVSPLSDVDTGDVGIYLEKLNADTTVENNTISGQFKHHIFLTESDAIVKNNILNSGKAHTLFVYNSNSQIISNQITNSGDNAIYVLKGATIIANNTIENAKTNGIRVDQISNVTASNNIIKNMDNYGIHISNSSNSAIVSENEISGNNERLGIYFNTCNGNNKIEKNTVRCGIAAGIYTVNSSGTISENDVQGCEGDALHIIGDENNIATFSIKDNTFKTASTSKYDIRLSSYSRGCQLSNNTFGSRGIKIADGVTYSFVGADGITNMGGIGYYITNGVINSTYTGFVDYNNSTYYVVNGVLSMPFKDVQAGAWYYNAVRYVYQNNIVKGYNATTFAPEDKLTRGMMVTLLYRMEGSPNNNGKSRFTDVNSSEWYAKAVKWAVDNGIVHGYDGTTKFGPNDNIIRQDLAGILRNYARYKGKDITPTGDLTKFSDNNKVDSYAQTSIKWAVGKGVITGNADGTLNPKGNATRAEAAAMLQKYCNRVGR